MVVSEKLSVEIKRSRLIEARALLKTNPTKAVDELTDLANENFPICMTDLGAIYANGEFVPRDLERAKYWYEKAYKANHVLGAFFLGKLKFIQKE